MEINEETETNRDAQLVELASPSEVGLLALAAGALAAALFAWRRRRRTSRP
ncbi:hypothetical protein AB0F81_14365 [Actinoplanes sp. NPDC024001]|uniref:hypothetical protein n=1 Tax=Actinoplanes sp. NPDC024001 TaxID=3154598 RepID=UPI0033DAEFB5